MIVLSLGAWICDLPVNAAFPKNDPADTHLRPMPFNYLVP
jgi:hypothetical protein